MDLILNVCVLWAYISTLLLELLLSFSLPAAPISPRHVIKLLLVTRSSRMTTFLDLSNRQQRLPYGKKTSPTPQLIFLSFL